MSHCTIAYNEVPYTITNAARVKLGSSTVCFIECNLFIVLLNTVQNDIKLYQIVLSANCMHTSI